MSGKNVYLIELQVTTGGTMKGQSIANGPSSADGPDTPMGSPVPAYMRDPAYVDAQSISTTFWELV